MRTQPPAIAPFLRSQTQAEILALLLLHPEQGYSISEIARRIGATTSVVHREITRLVEAGVLLDEAVGRTRLVRANREYRLIAPLTQIIVGTLGPIPVLTEELSQVVGIDRALIFGSWAARHSGLTGREPRDVDVLVVGEASRADLNDAAHRAEQRLGVPVNITRVLPRSWHDQTEPFLRTLSARPTIPLDLQEPDP